MGQRRGEHEHQSSKNRPWSAGRQFSKRTTVSTPQHRHDVVHGQRDIRRLHAIRCRQLITT